MNPHTTTAAQLRAQVMTLRGDVIAESAEWHPLAEAA
jgi:hypothetical protein